LGIEDWLNKSECGSGGGHGDGGGGRSSCGSILIICCVSVLHKQLSGSGVSAMRDYQHAIRLNPNYALAYYNAANIYLFNRQFKQASYFALN